MIFSKMSKCPYCGSEMKISAEDAFIVCEYCGREMEVPRFTQEEKRLTQAVEEMKASTEAAEAALKEATQRAEESDAQMEKRIAALAKKISEDSVQARMHQDELIADLREAAQREREEARAHLNELKSEQHRLSDALSALNAQQQAAKVARLQHCYELGETAQRAGRFDEAIGHFQELLVMSEDHEAEVHWRIVMCRYGVEYVREQSSETWLPTITHMIVDSIEDDADYRAASKYARSERMRAYYKEEAQRIDDILDKYREVYGQERPYDVFISVKQGDSHGRPTEDSMIAMELYYMLKGMGLHVFNSRISLQEHAGLEYEPYIMAALMTSKTMLVVGTRSDYMTSPWVRNEWRRFRWLQENGKETRRLIAYIVGMKTNEIPKEMGALQIINAQASADPKANLRRIVEKDFGRNIPGPKKDAHDDEAKRLRRAELFLEEGNIEKCEEYLEMVLEENPEAGQAYALKLCIAKGVNRIDKLGRLAAPIADDLNFRRAMGFGDDKLKQKLTSLNESVQANIRAEEERRAREAQERELQKKLAAEREEQERQERLQREREANERREREAAERARREREERERREREERERKERERQESEAKKRAEQEAKDREAREKAETERMKREALEHVKNHRSPAATIDDDIVALAEKKRLEKEEAERKERKKAAQEAAAKEEQAARERAEKEQQKREEREKAEKERLNKEALEQIGGKKKKGGKKKLLVIAAIVVVLAVFNKPIVDAVIWNFGSGDMIHKRAYHVIEDEAQQVEWYRRAAEKGSGAAYIRLVSAAEMGHEQGKKILADLAPDLETLAKEDPLATYALGRMYERGYGVDVNVDTSVYWYLRSVELGVIGVNSLIDAYVTDEPMTSGQQSDQIKALQRMLVKLNLLDAEPNGVYGDRTKKAVAEFQRTMGVEASGTADRWTQEAICRAAAGESPEYEENLANMGNTGSVFDQAMSADADGDYDLAIALLGAQGMADELFVLGENHADAAEALSGDAQREEYLIALDYLQAAAMEDHIKAATFMGNFYLNGWGVEKDYDRAYELFVQGADMGNYGAMNNIGYMLDEGLAPSGDPSECIEWYKKASDAGSGIGSNNLAVNYYLGNYVQQDFSEAMKYFRRAMDQSDTLSDSLWGVPQQYLGGMYLHGQGTEINVAEALRLCTEAVELGNDHAHYELGCIHLDYEEYRDYATAYEHFMQGARLTGSSDCIYMLGHMTEDGEGVVQNFEQAYRFYAQSARLGYGEAIVACEERGILFGDTSEYPDVI